MYLADDSVVIALGIGDIIMSLKTAHGVRKGALTNVWYISKLSRSLISFGKFTKD